MPPKRPTDVNQRAKLIVAMAVGDEEKNGPDPKDPVASASGRLGGQKGGKARAKKLTAEERSAIAKKAAQARWKSKR